MRTFLHVPYIQAGRLVLFGIGGVVVSLRRRNAGN